MRSSTSTHLVWALLVAVAFLIGLFVDGDQSDAGVAPVLRETGTPGAGFPNSTAITAAQDRHSASEFQTIEVQPALSPEQARALTFDLLREPNRMERFSQLCDVLRRVTPENWQGVLDAFTRQTAFEGREHGEEWKLLLHRIGAVAEAAAVIDALNSHGGNRDHRARNILEGWVMADPDAAVAWVKTLSPENRKVLDPAVIYALAGIAPVQALELALVQKETATREWAISELSKVAVQHGGFRQGEELLRAVINRPDIDEAVKRRIFIEMAQKRMTMARVGERPMDSLDWLDRYLVGEQSPAGPAAVGQIVASAAASNPSAAMQWLDARAERLTAAQSVPAYTAALQAVYRESPEQFTSWLGANQKHPAHDLLVEAYTNDLIAFGRTTEATEWMKSVQDAATRQRIQAALEKSARKNAAK